MKSTTFGSKAKGDLLLELAYVVTAIMVAVALSVSIPRIGETDNTKFPACFTNICFA